MDEESVLEMDVYGTKWWKNKDGKFHRLDGPAIEFTDGYKNWYVNGILHREDGPAVIDHIGENEWYLRGVRYKSKETFFEHLSEEAKSKCLFSEDFLNG
jgi:hypothetical protein